MRPSLTGSPRDLHVALASIALFLVFDRTAAWLGSTRGEAGIVVCGIVLALLFITERLLTGAPFAELLRSLGLKRPAPLALGIAVALCVLLGGFFPLFSVVTATDLQVRADAAVLAVGIFAQGGIAEETLFRGFLYRHLRERRTFWRAATLAAVPFVAAHLLLFATLDFAVALAALLVSVSLTFPLARLFDLAGRSIWPSAIVHAMVQGAIKLVEPAGDALPLAAAWMAVSALAPWVVFAFAAHRAPARATR
jgi:membrane protease YdiL (CAAX protease family)